MPRSQSAANVYDRRNLIPTCILIKSKQQKVSQIQLVMLGDLSSVWGRHLAQHLHVCMRNARCKNAKLFQTMRIHIHCQ